MDIPWDYLVHENVKETMRYRNIRISLRLNESENNHLMRQVRMSGLKIEPFLRSLIVGHIIKPRPPEEWPELVRQVSAIGNNINQLVRVANSEKKVSTETLQNIMRLQAAIWERVKNI